MRRPARSRLILPSLYSELEGEALPEILDELAEVPYLHRIIIGLDRADEAQYRARAQASSRDCRRTTWCCGTTARGCWRSAPGSTSWALRRSEPGKGKNVWTAIGYLIACADSAVMAIHDCDILTYDREMLDPAGLPGGASGVFLPAVQGVSTRASATAS